MMHFEPFKYIYYTLLHEFVSEDILEDPLDATNPFGKGKIKHYVLTIKPLVMKR